MNCIQEPAWKAHSLIRRTQSFMRACRYILALVITGFGCFTPLRAVYPLQPPRQNPAPFYPVCAQSKGVEGAVDLALSVAVDGAVSDVKVLTERPSGYGFAASALAVLPKWRFTPKNVDGQPVRSRRNFTVLFRLDPNPRASTYEDPGSPIVNLSPAFPDEAVGLADEGFVAFGFTLLPDGTPSDPRLLQEAPQHMGFAEAADLTLAQLRFRRDPREKKPAPKQAQYCFSFERGRP